VITRYKQTFALLPAISLAHAGKTKDWTLRTWNLVLLTAPGLLSCLPRRSAGLRLDRRSCAADSAHGTVPTIVISRPRGGGGSTLPLQTQQVLWTEGHLYERCTTIHAVKAHLASPVARDLEQTLSPRYPPHCLARALRAASGSFFYCL